jgi:hypothetical protein
MSGADGDANPEDGDGQYSLDIVRDRVRAYEMVFGGPAGKAVLEDLSKYCGYRHYFDLDPYVNANMGGRRDVFMRILDHLHLDESELKSLYRAAVLGKGA